MVVSSISTESNRKQAAVSRVLILATSTTPPASQMSIDSGERPRIDYLDLQSRLSADVIDFSSYEFPPYRLMATPDRLSRLAWGQAIYALRHWRDYDTVYSLSEDVGLPLAFLLRLRGGAPRHIMIAHNLLSPRKVPLVRLMGVMDRFHRIVVLSRAAVSGIVATYKVDPARVVFRMDAIDEAFWRPRPGVRPVPGFVLSVGRARRDYTTLVEAFGGLPATLHIQGGSQWAMARRPDRDDRSPLPANVELGEQLSYCELRASYERAAFVVVPLQRGAHHSAGSVAVKEAMAMGKAVIVASDGGLEDYVRDGETGIIVPASDVFRLREAIKSLLADPAWAQRMGRNGRALLEREMRYDVKIDWLAALADGESVRV